MIVNQQRQVRIARKPLERFLREVHKELALQDAGVTICFVSDVEIAGMNERFRSKEGPTDVLSFPAGTKWQAARTRGGVKARGRPRGSAEDSEREDKYLGDIAIAPETARRYAKKNGRTLDSELRVLILHGVLHLLGYDHETDRGEMDRLEQKLRRTFGLV